MSEAVFRKIKDILEGIEYDEVRHKPVFTSEDAAKVRGVELCQGVKSLVFKGHDFILALVPGDRKVNVDKLEKISGEKKLKLARPEEVLEVTDCEIGSVPPFGHKNKLKTYLDRKVLENDEVNFNAGLHEVSITMKASDFENIIQAEICDIII